MPSKIIRIFLFLFLVYSAISEKISSVELECSIKAVGSLLKLIPAFSLLFIKS